MSEFPALGEATTFDFRTRQLLVHPIRNYVLSDSETLTKTTSTRHRDESNMGHLVGGDSKWPRLQATSPAPQTPTPYPYPLRPFPFCPYIPQRSLPLFWKKTKYIRRFFKYDR